MTKLIKMATEFVVLLVVWQSTELVLWWWMTRLVAIFLLAFDAWIAWTFKQAHLTTSNHLKCGWEGTFIRHNLEYRFQTRDINNERAVPWYKGISHQNHGFNNSVILQKRNILPNSFLRNEFGHEVKTRECFWIIKFVLIVGVTGRRPPISLLPLSPPPYHPL